MKKSIIFICILLCCVVLRAEPPKAPFLIFGQIMEGNASIAKDTPLTFSVNGIQYNTKVESSPFGTSFYRFGVPAAKLPPASDNGFTVELVAKDGKAVSVKQDRANNALGYAKFDISVDNQNGNISYPANLITSKEFSKDSSYTLKASFKEIENSPVYISGYSVAFYIKKTDEYARVFISTFRPNSKGEMTVTAQMHESVVVKGGYMVITPLNSEAKPMFSTLVYIPLAVSDI